MENIRASNYPIYFKNIFEELNQFLQKGNYSKIFILVDVNTSEKCLPIINFQIETLQKYDIIEVDAGEENKNIDIAIGVWRTLLDFEADKNALLINLGGGMISDLGGFCASTFMRGIDFINIPTTLLAQVDASIGGKTGVDLEHYKNIIGYFSNPKAVFIDEVFLETLAQNEIKAAWSEIIKHGLVWDKSYLEDFLLSISKNEINYQKFIFQSVQIKNKIVEKDPFDKGLRRILNFGHSIGHALESFGLEKGNTKLLHGEAVFLGLLAETFISFKLGILSKKDFQKIEQFICPFLPKMNAVEANFTTIIRILKKDKKNQEGKLLFVVLEEIGKARYDQEVKEELILEALQYLIDLQSKNSEKKNL